MPTLCKADASSVPLSEGSKRAEMQLSLEGQGGRRPPGGHGQVISAAWRRSSGRSKSVGIATDLTTAASLLHVLFSARADLVIFL